MYSDDLVLLEARNLQRRHPDRRRWLLENVSLDLFAATRISITGSSGSGKTLLLRALAMLDPLDGGEIRWQGRPVSRDAIPEFRRKLIYLQQRPAIAEPAVEAALQRPFRLAVHRRRQFDRGRIVAWLDRLGRRESFLKKRAVDLSGGEAQIVALLRALQLDPTVLSLDEPTAALDPATTKAAEEMLGDWLDESPQPRAIIWVTHDAEQAARVAPRRFHMDAGRLRKAS